MFFSALNFGVTFLALFPPSFFSLWAAFFPVLGPVPKPGTAKVPFFFNGLQPQVTTGARFFFSWWGQSPFL